MYYNNRDIRIEEYPIPEIKSDELLLKMVACGICGSDVMEWYRVKSAPRVLGHEVSGIIEKVGENVHDFQEGDRVVVTHHVPCNTCKLCRSGHETACELLHKTNFYPGGFSEYIRIPAINIERGMLRLPDTMTFEEGTFIEPLGCVVRAQRIAQLKSGQTVLILGSGIAGLLHIKLAKINGAGKIFATDINERRLNAAKAMGADITIHANDNVVERLKEYNNNELADIVIVCAGVNEVIEHSFSYVNKGGTILFFAPLRPETRVPFPMFDLWRNDVTITNSYGAVLKDLKTAMELIHSGRINVKDMITHILPLEETAKGFRLVEEGKESIKVIIRSFVNGTTKG